MKADLPPFQRFVDLHREQVWRFLVASVGREEAEDCFQETFVAALRAYGRLAEDSNLAGWVLTIAHRKAIDAHRANGRRPAPVADVEAVAVGGLPRGGAVAGGGTATGDSAGAGGSAADGTSAETGDELWEAVRELPARQRSAVVLRFVGDLPHREIAAAMGCSEDAARRSLHEGLKRLRKELTI
jgi:RNA polymerase sigma factor (sigma-70 family)